MKQNLQGEYVFDTTLSIYMGYYLPINEKNEFNHIYKHITDVKCPKVKYFNVPFHLVNI